MEMKGKKQSDEPANKYTHTNISILWILFYMKMNEIWKEIPHGKKHQRITSWIAYKFWIDKVLGSIIF